MVVMVVHGVVLWMIATGLLCAAQGAAITGKPRIEGLQDGKLGDWWNVYMSDKDFEIKCSNCTAYHDHEVNNENITEYPFSNFNLSEVLSVFSKFHGEMNGEFIHNLLDHLKKRAFSEPRVIKRASDDERASESSREPKTKSMASTKLVMHCDHCFVHYKDGVNNGNITLAPILHQSVSEILKFMFKIFLRRNINVIGYLKEVSKSSHGQAGGRKLGINKRDSGDSNVMANLLVKNHTIKCSNCTILSATRVNNGYLTFSPNVHLDVSKITKLFSRLTEAAMSGDITASIQRLFESRFPTGRHARSTSEQESDSETTVVRGCTVQCTNCTVLFACVVNNGDVTVKPAFHVEGANLSAISPELPGELEAISSALSKNMSASGFPLERTVSVVVRENGTVKYDGFNDEWNGGPDSTKNSTISCSNCIVLLASAVNYGSVTVKPKISLPNASTMTQDVQSEL